MNAKIVIMAIAIALIIGASVATVLFGCDTVFHVMIGYVIGMIVTTAVNLFLEE